LSKFLQEFSVFLRNYVQYDRGCSAKGDSTMNKTQTVSIRINSEHLKHLRKMSHYISIERGKDVNYVDLIHEAIEQVYPISEEGTLDKTSKKASIDEQKLH